MANLCYTVLPKRGTLVHAFTALKCNLQNFQINTYSYPGKILSVAGMLSLSFTKPELQQNQLKHKQPPQQIDFAILQNGTLKPVRYLIPSKKYHHIKNMIHILILLIMQ